MGVLVCSVFCRSHREVLCAGGLRQPHSVCQVALELTVLLPHPSRYWNYRCALHTAQEVSLLVCRVLQFQMLSDPNNPLNLCYLPTPLSVFSTLDLYICATLDAVSLRSHSLRSEN